MSPDVEAAPELSARPIVVLGQDGPGTRIVFHELKRAFPDTVLILEEPVSRATMLRRRLKRLGFIEVAGQVLFLAIVVPLLRRSGRRRVRQIEEVFNLDVSPIHPDHRFETVNSDEARRRLQTIDPSVVVVNGTRIIAKETFGCVSARFINIHVGITPRYRGVHGGYWALTEGRPDLVGTTIHLIDEGIDTGKVLAQETFSVERDDTFVTYPYLHVAAVLPALVRTIADERAGRALPAVSPLDDTSQLRYHPTIWGYLATRLRKGVR